MCRYMYLVTDWGQKVGNSTDLDGIENQMDTSSGNFRAAVVMSSLYHVLGFVLKSFASEGSWMISNYSITKLVFVSIVILN